MSVPIVFLADLFVEDFLGGGELTTEAIIDSYNGDADIIKIRSDQLTEEIIQEYRKNKWIICSFFNVKADLILNIMSNAIDYSLIEYDYKYCIMRIPKLHKKQYGMCCENTTRGQLISLFFQLASNVWYMSQKQKEWYEKTFPAIKAKNHGYVLSSILDKKTIDTIKSLDCSSKNNKYLIQDRDHILKGRQRAIKIAEEKELEYELFSNLKYEDMLKKFAESKGLIFTPTEFDTCPRVTIEAKLLGCDLILSENVQHAEEEWFKSDSQTIIQHMKERTEFFWKTI